MGVWEVSECGGKGVCGGVNSGGLSVEGDVAKGERDEGAKGVLREFGAFGGGEFRADWGEICGWCGWL